MSSALRTRKPHEALPAEIYLPLVDSLYQDGRTLFVGTVLVTASVILTYWKTGEILLLFCAAAIVGVTFAADPAGFFESIDGVGDAAGGQAGELGELPGGHGAVLGEQREALEGGQIHAESIGDGLVQEDRLHRGVAQGLFEQAREVVGFSGA